MVTGAPSLDNALFRFLEFAGDKVLAAHNATFDIGFITAACKRFSVPFNPTLSTHETCPAIMLAIRKFDLHTVANELNAQVQFTTGIRGCRAVAYVLSYFLENLKSRLDGYPGDQRLSVSNSGPSAETLGGLPYDNTCPEPDGPSQSL